MNFQFGTPMNSIYGCPKFRDFRVKPGTPAPAEAGDERLIQDTHKFLGSGFRRNDEGCWNDAGQAS